MSYRLDNLRLAGSPIAQFLSLVAGALIAVGAVLLGAVVLFLFLGLAVVAGLAFYIRFWWQRRRLQREGHRMRSSGSGEIVEVEYTVIEERDSDRHRD